MDGRAEDKQKRTIRTGSRPVETAFTKEDVGVEGSLRPKTLATYIGQKKIKESLDIYISAAKKRGDSLDHILFYGPPGLGKTTLSQILANEMGVHIKITSGPAIEKPGEMAAILNNLKSGDLLFIDEIHRLNRQVEEVLYPAMEDFAIDIMIGKGPSARSIRLELPRFTLVGATTRAGMLSAPLRDRFGIVHRVEFYEVEELCQIIEQSANVRYDGIITKEVAEEALDLMGVDKMGLDHTDQNLLLTMIEKFDGGPVGLDTLAAAVGEDSGTIEDVYEPYLLKNGLLNRTPRGRVATLLAYTHLGLAMHLNHDL